MKELYADIAVSLPVEGLFTYRVPPSLRDGALFGHRALVPFGRRVVTGYIVGIKREAGVDGLKDILDILDDSPIFDEKRLRFYGWMSSYYFSPLGEVLSLIHPAEANVRSRRLLTLTDAGGAALNEATGLGRDILEASKKGVKILTLLKRFRGKPVCGTIARLKQDGLVVEESILEGGGRSKMERMVSLNHGAHGPHGLITPDELRRSPVQLRVYEYILKNGDTPAADLSSEINGADGAVKKLIEKGGLRIYLRQVIRDPMSGIAPRNAGHEPNQEQKEAIDAISESMKKSVFSPFLLYGVTGSGKTLVYLKLLQEAVAAGRQAILLVPEISLTPQTAAYLSGSFHGRVVVMHSALSSGERMDAWERISGGKVDVVVGARSALFSPLSKLSLIIIDEEHETSYKQEEGVRYNGRDAALMLGKHLDITVVLGSATPSVETFYNGHAGKLTTLYLRKRVLDRTLPKIELLDMRGKKDTVISTRLAGLLCDTLKHGRQSLLFLNRRGFSNSIICRDCGHAFQCPNCSVSLTFHKYPLSLVCHYCDLSSAPPSECPVCRGVNLRDPGIGTEKVDRDPDGVKGASLPGYHACGHNLRRYIPEYT
ncbi:MAG: primosomal protein N' [Deltaproteobacteria bacterium]|nr:primosomal protein N' [Deltaproteobacteria bacterium]